MRQKVTESVVMGRMCIKSTQRTNDVNAFDVYHHDPLLSPAGVSLVIFWQINMITKIVQPEVRTNMETPGKRPWSRTQTPFIVFRENFGSFYSKV